jgi:hypothetical protein
MTFSLTCLGLRSICRDCLIESKDLHARNISKAFDDQTLELVAVIMCEMSQRNGEAVSVRFGYGNGFLSCGLTRNRSPGSDGFVYCRQLFPDFSSRPSTECRRELFPDVVMFVEQILDLSPCYEFQLKQSMLLMFLVNFQHRIVCCP